MNLLNKLTIKNLKLNKKRTIVTIIGIMLSVALITAVASIYSSGINSLINFEKKRNGNYHVAFYDVPVDDLNAFKNNRAIDMINLIQNVGYAKIDSKNEFKPYAFIKSFTKNSFNNLAVRLVEGRLPKNDDEIVIPTHLRTNGRLKLNVGDTITLDVGKRVDNEGYELNQNNPYYLYETSGNIDDTKASKKVDSIDKLNAEKIINTTKKTYKIVGIIERPDYKIESYSAPGYTFITYMDENSLNDKIDIFVRYKKKDLKDLYNVTAGLLGINGSSLKKYLNPDGSIPNYEEYKKIEEEIFNAKYKIGVNNYLVGLETNPISSSSIGGLGIVVCIVISIIVFTSIFCIKNSFEISITEKIKQYGMLRSIGATKKQIRQNVFYEASILGVIGIPLGLFLGLFATFILIIISNYFLKDMLSFGLKLQYSFSIIAIVIAIILGIVTIYFSAFKSAKKASKISPIDSIRNSANIKINPKKIKTPKMIKKLFGIGGEISYKNLKRNKNKYRTTIISIAVSVFVFIALASFMSMAFATVRNEIGVTDLNFSISATDYNEEEYLKLVETTKFDTIKDYVIFRESYLLISDNLYSEEYFNWRDTDFTLQNHYLPIVVLGDYQYNKYIKSLGLEYNDIKEKGIFIDNVIVQKYDEDRDEFISKQMRIHNINENDVLNGKLEDSSNFEIEIGTITEKMPLGLEYQHSGSILILSDELFDKITTSESINIRYQSSNATKLQDEIEDYLTGITYSYNNSEENARMMNSLFTLIGIFLYGFIIVITLIGITNIFNTITTNMELRRQEFAMLKSIGMTTKEFNKMIRLESLFMGLKALIFGVPIGMGLSYLIYHFLVSESGRPYKLPILAICLAVAIVFILISIIMKYSINKINKQNTIETIRNENI